MKKKEFYKFMQPARKLLLPLLLLVGVLQSTRSFAQCTAPTGATISMAPAYCLGTGKVFVDTVLGGVSGDEYQYQLQYDSAANTSVVKPYQTSDTFINVSVARYKVYIRKVCSTGFSTVYTSASIAVTGTTTPLSVQQAIALTKSSCGNGSLKITATGGNTSVPYQYALVPSLSTTEPAASYVRPKQAGNTFTGLPAGTYYARVYDTCGSYVSAPVVIDSVVESVSLTTSRNNYLFYGCDSIYFAYKVTINNKVQLPAPPEAGERFWITYNGTTDTLGNSTTVYTASAGNAEAMLNKRMVITSWPATITYGYRSSCGNIYQRDTTLTSPKIRFSITGNSVSCTQKTYGFVVYDSLSNFPNYYNTRMSLDSGLTWSALNTSFQHSDTFVIGSTNSVWIASGCDTEKVTFTANANVLNPFLLQFTSYSCNNKSGFYIGFPAGSYSGNVDSIKFRVLSQPVAGALPDSFYMRQNTVANGDISGYRLTYNLPPGTYTFLVTDQCGAIDTSSITINPTVLSYTISPVLSCIPSQSGFRLNLTETNYQPYAGYSYLRAIVTNTTTNQVDSFLSASQISRPTTIDVTGLSNGQYTIRVVRVLPSFLPYPTCSVDATYTNTANQPLSLNQSTFTSACANGTATVAADVQGGGGGNQFSLDIQGSGGAWTQVAGPQSSPVFNNLNANNTYRIRVTDVCGSGTQYSTSFSNSGPTLEFITTTSPCPGDAFTMLVDPNAGAAYAWQKNSTPISGATGSSYTVNPVAATGSDTFKVKVTYGNCDLFSNTYIINPVYCGMPLPILLRSFNGFLNPQDMAQLKWEVSNYETVKSFDIEYGSDGISFRKAGTLVSNNSRFYQYTDEQRKENVLFYRLKMVSIDGEAVYSNVLKLNKKGNGTLATAKVYPTIVSDKINISYTATADESLNWNLLNIQGSKVRSGTIAVSKGASIVTIDDLSELPGGTYILSLDNNASFKQHEKIVIRK